MTGVCRDRGVRRPALRPRADLLPARPRRHAGLRPRSSRWPSRAARTTRAASRTSTTSARSRGRASSTASSSAGSNSSSASRRRGTAVGALLFDAFLPEEELLPIARAMSRVFARLGERRNARARALPVRREEARSSRRPGAPSSRSGRSFPTARPPLDRLPRRPPRRRREADPPGGPVAARPAARGLRALARASNVIPQRQLPGCVMMPLLTAPPRRPSPPGARAAPSPCRRRFTGDSMRTTADQSMLLRWVSEADLLPAVYARAPRAVSSSRRPAPAPSPTSPRARAPTRASSGSRPRVRSPRSSRRSSARRASTRTPTPSTSTPRRRAAASARAASTTSPISASSA